MSLQNIFYTRNSVLELGHVTNVTIFLKETAASGWGSRSHAVCFGNERGAYYSANVYVYLYTHVHMYVHDPAYILTLRVFSRFCPGQ